MKFPTALLLAISCVLPDAIAAPASGTTVSIKSLLGEMVDADGLARLPAQPYRCLQASSHDRRAASPDKPGWFANADWSHFIRDEQIAGRIESVMMEDDGPGAIVRLWFTWFGPMDGKLNHSTDGVIRIYLDGGAEPAISGTLTELLVKQGLVAPPFAETTPATAPEINRAYNIYLPIPYAKGCKVTYESKGKLGTVWNKGEALYYTINYRDYHAGTRVQTFTRADLTANAAYITESGKRLLDAPAIPGTATTARLQAEPLAPSAAASVVELTGPAAIRQIRLRLNGINDPQVLATALRGLEVQLDFDKQRCVRIPAGDFFATGTRVVPYKTRFFEATEANEMICRWVMPYAKIATMRLVNKGQVPVAFECHVIHAPWEWNKQSLHFRAVQSALLGISVKKQERGAQDINFATLRGKGRLVGDTLAIRNTAAQGMKWWGEGDEKIYVDDDGFPSHFGTGTEDYYGYAHCRPEAFSSPFHAQPYGNGNLDPGPTAELQSSVNTRLRLLDDIPFDRSLKFDMELWHWQDAVMDFVPTVFYYLAPDQAAHIDPRGPQA